MDIAQSDETRLGSGIEQTVGAAQTSATVKLNTPYRLEELISGVPITHRRLKRGDFVFRAGAEFRFLYRLNAGFIKTRRTSEDGRELITGFHIRGDLLGLEAVSKGRYGCDAIALDVCDVSILPYETLIHQTQRNPAVMRELNREFSSEICSEHDLLMTLSTLSAQGRTAAFLLAMSSRFESRGFPGKRFTLRLTRNEIGSLLGLQLETVSRALSFLAKRGLISVHMREIELLDDVGLRTLATKGAA